MITAQGISDLHQRGCISHIQQPNIAKFASKDQKNRLSIFVYTNEPRITRPNQGTSAMWRWKRYIDILTQLHHEDSTRYQTGKRRSARRRAHSPKSLRSLFRGRALISLALWCSVLEQSLYIFQFAHLVLEPPQSTHNTLHNKGGAHPLPSRSFHICCCQSNLG